MCNILRCYMISVNATATVQFHSKEAVLTKQCLKTILSVAPISPASVFSKCHSFCLLRPNSSAMTHFVRFYQNHTTNFLIYMKHFVYTIYKHVHLNQETNKFTASDYLVKRFLFRLHHQKNSIILR